MFALSDIKERIVLGLRAEPLDYFQLRRLAR